MLCSTTELDRWQHTSGKLRYVSWIRGLSLCGSSPQPLFVGFVDVRFQLLHLLYDSRHSLQQWSESRLRLWQLRFGMFAEMVEDEQGVSEVKHICVGIVALVQVAAALMVDGKLGTSLQKLAHGIFGNLGIVPRGRWSPRRAPSTGMV